MSDPVTEEKTLSSALAHNAGQADTCPIRAIAPMPKLVEFVDLDLLQRFQDHFARAVGVSVVIRDTEGRMVTHPTIPNRFCALVCATRDRNDLCERSSVKVAMEALATAQVAEGSCHAGFYQFAAPIKLEEMILGVLVVGEIAEGPLDEARVTALALDLGINPGDLVEAARDHKPRSASEIALSVDFIQFAASALAQLCFERFQLQKRIEALQTLRHCGDLFSSSLELREVLQTVVRTVAHTLGVKAVGLRLLDDTGQLLLKAVSGLSQDYLRKGPVPLEGSQLDQEALDGGPIYVRDLRKDPRVLYPQEMDREGIRSLLLIGLKVKGRPIGVMRVYAAETRVFDEAEVQLTEAIAAQAAIAIENARLYEAAIAKERMENELRLAAEIQGRLLPASPPQIPGFEIAAVSMPCRMVGGDFYDFLSLPDGKLGIAIADVCGKSVSGALLMAATRSAVRVQAEHTGPPARLVERVNRSLARDTRPEEFASLFYAVLEPGNRRLTYTNAGHNYPLLYRDDRVLSLDAGGMVCGVRDDNQYEQRTVELRSGDVLVLYTDGLNEARNLTDEMFGLDRLHQLVRAHLGEPASELVQRIIGAVQQFQRGREQSDDMTIMLVKVD